MQEQLVMSTGDIDSGTIAMNPANHTPSEPVPPSTPPRPTTPKSVRVRLPCTPESKTPKLGTGLGNETGPISAAVYLSSPIRRRVPIGTMTPGRPTSRHAPHSPFKTPRRSHGRVSIPNDDIALPGMPLQFLFMTTDQAKEISELDAAKEALQAAIQQGETFRKAAQQFRTLASQYIFQHKLSVIEVDENEQRHEVETNIHKREIEKLMAEAVGNDRNPVNLYAQHQLKQLSHRINELENQVTLKDQKLAKMTLDIETLQRRLADSRPSSISPNLDKPALSGPSNERLSPLEVLASQVLSHGIQSDETRHTPFVHSPFSSPYHGAYSPARVLRAPEEGKRLTTDRSRRPSSASTISLSDNDTIDED